ncbi:MAG: DUF4038 domain-containing protein [Kiritimatiellae bacterium]|nr:DUF4038 domain-containing protein [Kiritimatiellia bacterium]
MAGSDHVPARRLIELAPHVLAPESAVRAGKAAAWSVLELALRAEADHAWWAFPVRADFVHAASATRLSVNGFWDGDRSWRVRFALPQPGEWTWSTTSSDPGLTGRSGRLSAEAPSAERIAANPNCRGHVRPSGDGRYFEYADGTPCFLLADTLWAANTARCGLAANGGGPFHTWLSDRLGKGFTAVLIQQVHGFGDLDHDPDGQRNEGGHLFLERDLSRLNAAHCRARDARFDAFWDAGLVCAAPVAWWGKTKHCVFSIEWARRLSAYQMVRYGAYGPIWCISGEYQYTFRDCGWTAADLDSLGQAAQSCNAFRRPMSIHPSGSTRWPAPHNAQSSRPFQESGWLDHHWLQTGQSIANLHYVAERCTENCALEPARPVFCAEAYYERVAADDPERAYHQRWQPWTAFLNGACGYGYGAVGIWQFYDPDDPAGETGKAELKMAVPRWQEALAAPGSAAMRYVRDFLTACEWWRLEPWRDRLRVDGGANPFPTETDISPPHAAAIPAGLCVVYVPRGNAGRTIEIEGLAAGAWRAAWLSPRDGSQRPEPAAPRGAGTWTIPPRPEGGGEDWVLVLKRGEEQRLA